MNFSQKVGLFVLILIAIAFVYFNYFSDDFKIPDFSNNKKTKAESVPFDENTQHIKKNTPQKENSQTSSTKIKIYILDKNAQLRSVNRNCNSMGNTSCFETSIKELVQAPSKWEKSKGFFSEIPQGTKILSIREGSDNIKIDLSSNFETGDGAESTYTRMKQLIKTVNSNTTKPVYLYINGKKANVIGGEGLMIKQPLKENSLDG